MSCLSNGICLEDLSSQQVSRELCSVDLKTGCAGLIIQSRIQEPCLVHLSIIQSGKTSLDQSIGQLEQVINLLVHLATSNQSTLNRKIDHSKDPKDRKTATQPLTTLSRSPTSQYQISKSWEIKNKKCPKPSIHPSATTRTPGTPTLSAKNANCPKTSKP